MATEEHLGLKLEADTKEWSTAFRTSEVAAKKLGKEVDNATKAMGEAGKQIKLAGVSWSDFTTGANQALELLGKISGLVNGALDLAHFAGEMENLGKRVPAERLKMMQTATEGAVTKIDLMRWSLRAGAGDLALTEKGMNNVLRAANTLSDQGFGDTMEIAEKLHEALRKGSSKALKEYGIALSDVKDKGDNVNKMLKEYQELANKDVSVEPQLKAIEKIQARIRDWMDEWKASFGEILGMLAVALNKAAEIDAENRSKVSAAGSARQHGGEALFAANRAFRQLTGHGYNPTDSDRYDIVEMQKEAGLFRALYLQAMQQQARADIERSNEMQRSLTGIGLMGAATAKAAGYGPSILGDHPDKAGGGAKGQSEWGADYIRQALLTGDRAISRGIDWGREVIGRASNFETPDFDLRGAGIDALGGGSQGGGDKLGQIYTDLSDKTTAVGAAYETLSAGIMASVDAAISGNDAIGRSALKAVQATLKAIALESTARAAFEGGMALASLAIGNGPGAATHGKAAASFAIAAAIAGVSSATAGAFASQGGGSPSAYGGPSSQPGGGNYTGGRLQSSGQQNITVHLYGTIAAGSKREVSEAVAGAVDQARRVGTSRSEQSLTVRFE